MIEYIFIGCIGCCYLFYTCLFCCDYWREKYKKRKALIDEYRQLILEIPPTHNQTVIHIKTVEEEIEEINQIYKLKRKKRKEEQQRYRELNRYIPYLNTIEEEQLC